MLGRFKAMHVFAAPVLILILSGFMGIKHIYATAVNPAILTVMALIALTGVLKKTLPFHRIIDLLGNSFKGVLINSSLITASLSGFINNTPVVALLIPLLKSKAQENGWNVSRFLMPLSFAAVAGGQESDADTLEKIIQEVASSRQTERGNREDDKRSESAMEDRKRQGYF